MANGKPAGVNQQAGHRGTDAGRLFEPAFRVRSAGSSPRSYTPPSTEGHAFPKAGLSLLLPPTKSRTNVPGKSQVKLGNRNADIQTSATRSVRSLLNRRACIPLGKIAKSAPPVEGVELGGNTEGTLPRLEFLCAVVSTTMAGAWEFCVCVARLR
jgi:hypothetical protein